MVLDISSVAKPLVPDNGGATVHKVLPPMKAWKRMRPCGGASGPVVTAETKKCAMELVMAARGEFTHWKECRGDWWHHLAGEAAVWIEGLCQEAWKRRPTHMR